MASKQLFKSISDLLNNPKKSFLETSAILIKLGRNILDNPNQPKYRRLPVGGKTVEKYLLPVDGALACLLDMGFIEAGEFFIFPENIGFDSLSTFVKQLEECHSLIVKGENNDQAGFTLSSSNVAANTERQATKNNETQFMNRKLPTVLKSEREFFASLKSYFVPVMLYENRGLQRKALQYIPAENIRVAAKVRFQKLNSTGEAIGMEEMILLELLTWFKTDFFHWMDKPECSSCRGPTMSVGNTTPTAAELTWGGNRVELYKCSRCNNETRFPRYNHPGKLLETRVGRCGEWANCFTLCCRAMGLEARYVLDWTDHVWTEVYSPTQRRWLHADSTEMLCDKPLTYEAGWHKKLTYIIAFSCDDIQDVTWRYTANQNEVQSRRKLCREYWLVNTIVMLRKQLQNKVDENRRQTLQKRLVEELAELMAEKHTAAGDELMGRTSGSLEWRLSRAEASLAQGNVIKPSQLEIDAGFIHIQYNCATDTYRRPHAKRNETEVKGWQNLVYECRNIFRKLEHDWNMVYLARTEESTQASISWRFDLRESNVAIDRVEIVSMQSACYEDGQVMWQLTSCDRSLQLLSGSSIVDEFKGSSEIILKADLLGGKGSVAWQHTQLFRQATNDNTCWPLDIRIYLK